MTNDTENEARELTIAELEHVDGAGIRDCQVQDFNFMKKSDGASDQSGAKGIIAI